MSKLLGIKFEMKGQENIVQDSGCVVLINHQSALDILGEFSGLFVLYESYIQMTSCYMTLKHSCTTYFYD